MDATGIAFAGLDGVWWCPAVQPFALPAALAAELERAARAIFRLFDVVMELYGTAAGAACGLNRLLEARVPAAIPRLHERAPVLALRPDFQLVPQDQGGYQLVATELEICPSAQGFAHAMQVGYGLPTDLADHLAAWLGGRELLFVGSAEWSEFLFEQLAFCRALAERGARASVLYSLPLATIDAEVRAGRRWTPPMFGVRERPARWSEQVLSRIVSRGLAPFLLPDERWPEQVGDALVWRFGYFDCFSHAQLGRLRKWRARGATFLNPTSFLLDSKVLLAALALPEVRGRIVQRKADALATLDACIPETLLLDTTSAQRVQHERRAWVLKFAGFDRANQAWGGRSLQLGAQHSDASWSQAIARGLELPWPVVAQRATPSARIDIAYLDERDEQHTLHRANTRLRAFMLRGERATNQPDDPQVSVCGVHLTASAAGGGVSESTEAVQAPVVFGPG